MASRRELFPLLYGGWNSYREWAENGFLPKEVVDDNTEDADQEAPGGREVPGDGGAERRGRHAATGTRDAREASAAAAAPGPAPPPAPPAPPRASPAASPPPAPASPGPFAAPGPPDDEAWSPGRFARPPEPTGPPPAVLRPYVMTSGRTRPRKDLPIEALVSTTGHGQATANRQLPEHRAICLLCRSTHSVAEIAASLGVPLGVARVLIDDLAHQGLVVVHGVREGGVTQQLLERVLDGLRRL